MEGASFGITATHPSGAVGAFAFNNKRHYRSGIHATECARTGDPANPDYALLVPHFFDVMSVSNKAITGPGLAQPLEWTYSYGLHMQSLWGTPTTPSSYPCTTCATEKSVTVVNPDDTKSRYYFGIRYYDNDGRQLRVEILDSADAVVRIETSTYMTEAVVAGQPFHGTYGSVLGGISDPASVRIRPIVNRTINQDSVEFVWRVNLFDSLARPTSVTKSSTTTSSHTKTEETTYHDNLSKWVLGQVETVSVDGTQVARTDYTPTYALPLRTYSFGKLQQTLGYTTTTGNQDGTLRTIKDGRNNVTTLTNWKRGIPQSIAYADATSMSAVVNNDGTIASVTDENGFKTSYAYDAMGRLTKTTYPSGDSPAWTPLTQSFTRIGAIEHGIPAGHWRQSIVQGDYRKNVFFDALWRPILVHEYEYGDTAGTLRSTRFNYDHEGRVTFASYVGGTTTAPDVGVRTTYDALGRVRKTVQDSELGPLITTHNYASVGGYKISTDPKGNVTRTWYEAYDQPTETMPAVIRTEEGAYTDIVRNEFGQPSTITRRNENHSVAVDRHYIYDLHQQLCRTFEPETGDTFMGYDAAGNLAWSAAGYNSTATGCLGASSVAARRVDRHYDSRNRLTSLVFPDGNGNQSWDYTPDGLPEQIITYNNEGSTAAVNAYTYNKRRLLTGESLAQGSQYSWGVGYGYNSLGHLDRHTYPHGLTVDYAPNALGQPSKAGTYAAGVDYYPNGAIAEFTYGNGILHTLEQNERGLPERSRDAFGGTPVHDDSYDYDPNGNVLAISDGRANPRGNRDMTYDGLDRLLTTTSPMFSPATYTYDVLDNLKTVKVAGRNHSYHYVNQQLINVKNVVGGASVIGLGYDAQGNLSNKNGVFYDFDYGNRLREVVDKESYRYDGHGRRIQASLPNGGNSIYSMYGNDGVLRYQEDYRKGEATNYIYLGGSLVAEVANAKPATTTPAITAPTSSNSGSYTVSWTAESGATRYVLDESINGGSWLKIKEGASTSWSVTGKTDASYRYRVRACAMECSGYSSLATVTVALIPKGAPTLTLSDDYVTDGNYTVSWTAVPLATRYELQEHANGGSWTLLQNTSARSRAISGETSGSYAYRVRACNGNGCAGWSGIRAVSVLLPPATPPALTVPTWGPSGAYTVSWAAASGATGYTLEESINGGGWTTAYTGTARSKAFSGRTAGTYAYRVEACNPAGCSSVSASDSTQVVYKPTAPAITVPSQNTDGSYTISWTAVATASSYKLEESANSGAWTLIHNGAANSNALTSKAAGSYRYRVSACNAAGCGPLSEIGTVTEIDPPAAVPILTAPGQNIDGSYTVSWTAVATATGYKLEESTNGGAWTLIHNAATRSKALSGKAAGSYRYRVSSCNAAGCGPFSVIGTVTEIDPPTGVPTLSAPAISYNGANYTVSWTAVSGATGYKLQEGANGAAWTHEQSNTSRSRVYSNKPAGSYRYRVLAYNDAGHGSYGTVRTTQVLYKPASAPTLILPASSATGSYTASWSAVVTATEYHLYERPVGGSWVRIHNASSRSKAISGKGNGTYEYRVQACNEGGCSVYSTIDTTVVTFPPSSAPIVTAPQTVQQNQSFTVSWGAVGGSTDYRLEQRPFEGSWAQIYAGSVPGKVITLSTVGARQYRVRACNVGGCGPYSAPVNVLVMAGGDCGPLGCIDPWAVLAFAEGGLPTPLTAGGEAK